MKLTNNFSLSELIEVGSARRLGFDEQFDPPADVVCNLNALAKNVLQPLRDHFGHSITITSGWRCKRVNKAVGGAPNSDHVPGYAADCQLWINGENRNQDLFDAVLKLGLPFRQMIDEYGTDDKPAWIHIAYNPKDNKRECLKARKVNGKTVYTKI